MSAGKARKLTVNKSAEQHALSYLPLHIFKVIGAAVYLRSDRGIAHIELFYLKISDRQRRIPKICRLPALAGILKAELFLERLHRIRLMYDKKRAAGAAELRNAQCRLSVAA